MPISLFCFFFGLIDDVLLPNLFLMYIISLQNFILLLPYSVDLYPAYSAGKMSEYFTIQSQNLFEKMHVCTLVGYLLFSRRKKTVGDKNPIIFAFSTCSVISLHYSS